MKRIRRREENAEAQGEVIALAEDIAEHPEGGPVLTGGDVDADWRGASMVGDEAVGGSVSTPDQDVVDEIGRALGVEQGLDAEVTAVEDVVTGRDRHRWRLEREAADEADARSDP